MTGSTPFDPGPKVKSAFTLQEGGKVPETFTLAQKREKGASCVTLNFAPGVEE